jgi:cytochrome c553
VTRYLLAACCVFQALAAVAQAPKPTPAPAPAVKIPYPEWLFPIDQEALAAIKKAARLEAAKAAAAKPAAPKPKPEPPPPEDTELLSIPESSQKYTQTRINDPFNPPDWHPESHGPLPDIVAKGRKPKIMACGYCHTPTGQGRPENSALAGLPEAYIKEQLLAFRSGTRPAIGPEDYLPARNMQAIAAALTDEEIDASAKYFAQQKLGRRVWVVEGINIPRAEPSDWVYKEVGGSEDLGERLIEVAPDITQHQRRDDRMQYTAYAPPGSLARGKRLATTGLDVEKKSKTQICATCHLANLKGTDKIPPIAGRSPTYLLRQLLAFKNGARSGEAAAQMTPTVEKLELEDMIDLAAYVGSLYP